VTDRDDVAEGSGEQRASDIKAPSQADTDEYKQRRNEKWYSFFCYKLPEGSVGESCVTTLMTTRDGSPAF
jgi:hypothetical protein